MPTPEELQALLASRRARQAFWKTKQDDYLSDRTLRSSDGPRPVLYVRIVVNEVIGQAGQANQSVRMAHFRILLVLDNHETTPASIELNSVRMTTTGETRLQVSSRNWVTSLGTTPKLAERDVPFIQGKTPTVDTILNLLVHNNRHHYKLHASGSGCRYWTKVVLQDLIAAGYMAPGFDSIVAAIMADIARVRPEILMLANAEGTFFQ